MNIPRSAKPCLHSYSRLCPPEHGAAIQFIINQSPPILMRKQSGSVVYSPSDLVRYFTSPFASWMDRFHLENPAVYVPEEETEDQRLI